MQPVVSVLICSLWKRAGMLASLLSNLEEQIERLCVYEEVQIIVRCDNGEIPTGTKRNQLLEEATGKYVVYIDDDDTVPDYYIEEILTASKQDCDAMAINGTMLTNGGDEKKWYISKDNPYTTLLDEKGVEYYLRYQNHISPIKREIANKFKFPDAYQFEDFEWATKIRYSCLIKTEAKIEKPMYIYKFVSLK
jgi:glycosyltransferase involved in cell wall biosynthesis